MAGLPETAPHYLATQPLPTAVAHNGEALVSIAVEAPLSEGGKGAIDVQLPVDLAKHLISQLRLAIDAAQTR
jgi:hypothetical protein